MKPPASLSLDLDNQWSYMKTHGDAGWESFPSYLDVVVPRVLPAMGLPAQRKLAVVERLLDLLAAAHRVVPLGVHAREILENGRPPTKRLP
jgi:hypothetical protein